MELTEAPVTPAVKRGYKKSEMGVFPVDWDVVELDSLVSIVDGDRGIHYPGNRDFGDAGHCLFLNASNVTKEGFKFDDCAFISREKDEQLSKGKLKRNDIVLTTRGTVGNFAHFDHGVPFQDIRINSGMVIVRNESSLLDTHFLYALLNSHLVSDQVERLSFGSAQPQLTVKGISKFGIVVPPLPEQRVIATALSDVDALLASLDALIAKKKAIKQGTMQRLLTGKQRLKGFEGEWEVKHLNQFAELRSGGYLSQTAYRPGSFVVQGAGSPMGWHDRPNILHPLTVIGRVGSVGRPRFMPDGCWVNNNAAALLAIPKRSTPEFLHATIQGVDWSMVVSTTAQPFLEVGALMRLQYAVPPMEEQTAIATVLTDMDAELGALVARRAKTALLKQGMMQELLTGRTRLV